MLDPIVHNLGALHRRAHAGDKKKAFFALTRDTEVIDTGVGQICHNLAITLPGRKGLCANIRARCPQKE